MPLCVWRSCETPLDRSYTSLGPPQLLHLSESDSLPCKGSTVGERMHTQLLTKDQIDAHLEKLDRQIKEIEIELETDEIFGVMDEPKRTQESPRIQTNELEAPNILGIIDERSKRLQVPLRFQSNKLESRDIVEPKRLLEPPGPNELEKPRSI